MQCQHPPEERQPVYEGTAVARTDRTFCGLCGHVLYIHDSQFAIDDSSVVWGQMAASPPKQQRPLDPL